MNYWWLVNIGSVNGLLLLPDGTETLPERMLIQFLVASWRHYAKTNLLQQTGDIAPGAIAIILVTFHKVKSDNCLMRE